MRSANQYLPSCLKGVCTEEVRSCHAMSDTYRDTEGNVNMFWNFGWAGSAGSANFVSDRAKGTKYGNFCQTV